MKESELKKILREHSLWIIDNKKGSRASLYKANLYNADLYRADLRGADLREANLYGADLSVADLSEANLYKVNLYGAHLSGANFSEANLLGANLDGADIRGAYLSGADLREANLYRTDFHMADLRGADLRGANLHEAYLRGADFRGANLYRADFRGADLGGAILGESNVYGVNLDKNDLIKLVSNNRNCPEEGNFIAWKKVYNDKDMPCVLKLEVIGERVSPIVGRKCRTNKVHVLEAFYLKGKPNREDLNFQSGYNKNFIYTIGKTIEEPCYDSNPFIECSIGIHFLISREEAEEYF